MLSKLLAKLFGTGILIQALGALVRHGLSALAGILAGLGIAKEIVLPWVDSTEQILIALIGILVSYLMSIANKNKLL